MAGTTSQSCVGRSLKGALSGEALAEWRSSEQVENGITSTSVPYWDPDQDSGPEPSDMYERYTWNIEKFSQINKRELRSNAFEAGSYKWYILIYPQGCDVCNHLSLFLCVADHDKLLPGWSHFAQFTITVVNKDPSKNKFSDTLHRFWKKEHDWGWKKFIELSKVLDGFVNDDRLTIIAQVQVIRSRPDRPFRCLHSDYRTELLRAYLTNVEQTCRSFAEERRNKLVILREDKVRWSSFCAFWIAIDQSDRRHMCREKRDAILRAMVKQFFIDKEVTSTLVMDSLYSGLRALEDQSKRGSKELPKAEELRFPIVHVEKDMFVLVEDVLILLERAYREPLPPLKDGKGPQNRLKDGCLEDSSKSSTARDDRRLTELGCRTIEIFVLAHIFSKIEVAYQETIAFQRQEELIREEAVWLAETEQKAKRGLSEKEKKLKKKQAKQKRNNRKGKDKEKTDKPGAAVEVDLQHTSSSDNKEVMAAVAELVLVKINRPEDASDVSDSVSCLPEVPSPSSEKRDASWDNDGVETHPVTDASSYADDGHAVLQREMNNPIVDDSSSTCSTDSVQSVVRNDLHSGYSLPKSRNRKSLSRIKIDGVAYINEAHNRQSESISRASKLIGAGGSGKSELQSKVAVLSLNSRKKDEHCTPDKEKTVSLQRYSSIKGPVEEKHPKEKAKIIHQSLSTPSKIMSPTVRSKPETKIPDPTNPVVNNKPSSELRPQAERATSVINTADSTSAVKLEVLKVFPQKTSKSSAHPLPVVSRPPSAPVVPGPKPSTSNNSHVQTSPVLSRSVSAAGRLGPDTSPSYLPLSYRNAIMGITRSQSPVSSLHSSESHTQTSNSPNSTCDPSQLHTQVSPSPSSSFNPSQSHTQMSNSPGYSCDPLHLQTKMSPSPSSSFNPPQTHTQVSHSPNFLFIPSQVNTQLYHSPSSSLYPSPTHTQVSYPLSPSFNPFQLHTQSPHSPSPPLDPSHLYTQTPNLISTSLSSPLSPDSIELVSSNPSISSAMANQNPSRSQERLSHGGLGDDFPHLDIINNLLDEEEFIMESLHSLSSVATQLPHHFNFPVDISGLSPELVAASTSSCRFDQDYYDDGYQLSYGSLAGHCDSLDLGDMMPQLSQGLYVNEPIDGLILSQWQMNASADLPYYSRTNSDVDSYPYNFLDYANLACRVMGNTAFGPSNAH